MVLFILLSNQPTVIFRKTNDFEIKYDNQYNYCEDYYLWLQLLFQQNCQFANLDGAYLKLRKNQSNDNNNNNISKTYQDERLNNSIQQKFLLA